MALHLGCAIEAQVHLTFVQKTTIMAAEGLSNEIYFYIMLI
jgi:hypothetical protein